MKRLTYLDGLKGWCAISVCIFHFLLMFAVDGFVGWKCMPQAQANPVSYYFANFPYSVLTNNSFPLYIFFAILSFVVAHSFLQNKNNESLKVKAITRYFRFMPIVVISCFIAYLLLKFNLCKFHELYLLTKNTWAAARIEESYSFFRFLKESLFTSFFKGTQLVSPLWCLHYLFLGSFLTYFVMWIYDKISNKYALFTFLIVIFYFVNPNYIAFIVGIISAIICHNEYSIKKINCILLIILGCVFGLFPPVLINNFTNIETFYAIGAGLILVGTHYCFQNNYFLNNQFILFCGKESFSLIIVQFLIMQSLNIYLFLIFHKTGMNFTMNIIFNLLINMTLSFFATWIYSKTITPLTNYICKKISSKFIVE